MAGEQLKPCPCGKTPTKLFVGPGSTFRWRYVEGDCGCGWTIEARVSTMRAPNDQADYADCVEAWNQMERG